MKDPQGPRQLEFNLSDASAPREDSAPAPKEKIRRGLIAAAGGPIAPKSPAKDEGGPPRLRVIQGGGQREREKLGSRDAVVRVLLEAGADLLLRKISDVRAEEIERQVNVILSLFDRVDREPGKMPELQRRLDDLEALMTETRARKPAR